MANEVRMTLLQQQVQEVEQRITAACERSGRSRAEIQIVAVTKYVSLERAKEILALGYKNLGENRWPEAEEKRTAIDSAEASWHFIGHLQSRKVRDVVQYFNCIHS